MEATIPQSELEISAGFHRGERWAFDAAARAYFTPLTHFVTHLLRDRDRAVDLTQEAFFLACRAHQKVDPNRPLGPWLYQIARNLAYKEYNRRIKRSAVPLEEMTDDTGYSVSDETASPRGDLMEKEALERIHRAMNRLKPKYRDILTLRLIQGLPSETISNLLRIPVSTVNTQTHRALKILRRYAHQEGLQEEELFS
ncbi:MAG: sigma-70 family RNA polymerase sigma factor [Candidatus Omnitrophica bacterium]|nr:sigma-70 family RNA polymerase sigma factor [Candidatus Omnitrophota bacterium]